MTGADPDRVRESLGCAPGTVDCEIDEAVMGNTIDHLITAAAIAQACEASPVLERSNLVSAHLGAT